MYLAVAVYKFDGWTDGIPIIYAKFPLAIKLKELSCFCFLSRGLGGLGCQ